MSPDERRNWTLALTGSALAAIGPLTFMNARSLGSTVESVVLFSAYSDLNSGTRFLTQYAQWACVIVLLFYSPGAIALDIAGRLRRWQLPTLPDDKRTALGHVPHAFLVSVVLQVAFIIGIRVADYSIALSRTSLLSAAAAAGVLMLAHAAPRVWQVAHAHRSNGGDWLQILAVVAAIMLFMFLLSDSLSRTNFSDDEQETIEFARSLAHTWVPNWLVTGTEGWAWGFYPVFVLFAYPTYALIVWCGESEFAARSLYWVSLAVAVLCCLDLYRQSANRPTRAGDLILIVLAMYVVTIVATFYSSWNPYFAGLAEPSGGDMFGFALFLVSVHMLFARHDGRFLVTALAQHMASPNGTVYTLTLLALLAAYVPAQRKRAGSLVAAYVSAVLLYHFATTLVQTVPSGANQLAIGQMDRYLITGSGWRDALRYLRMTFVLTGGAVLLLPWVFRRSPSVESRIACLFLTLHLSAPMVLSSLRHVHYHLPLYCAVVILALAGVQQQSRRVRMVTRLAMATVLVLAILLLQPRRLNPVTNARELGEATRLDCHTSSLQELYGNTRSAEGLFSGFQEGITVHTWLYYSQGVPRKGPPVLVLADIVSPPLTGFSEVGRGSKCILLVRDGFDRRRHAPTDSYQDEAGWSLLAVDIWRTVVSAEQRSSERRPK